MKTLLCLFAAVSVFGFIAPLQAGAPVPNETRIVSYKSNGTPVYAVYRCVGYDMSRNPIFRWVTQVSIVHHYPSYSRSYYYRPSYSRSYYGNVVRLPPVHIPVAPSGGHTGHTSHGGGYTGSGGGHTSHGGGHTSHSGGSAGSSGGAGSSSGGHAGHGHH